MIMARTTFLCCAQQLCFCETNKFEYIECYALGSLKYRVRWQVLFAVTNAKACLQYSMSVMAIQKDYLETNFGMS